MLIQLANDGLDLMLHDAPNFENFYELRGNLIHFEKVITLVRMWPQNEKMKSAKKCGEEAKKLAGSSVTYSHGQASK